jgi:hypothetical protein
MAGADYEYAPEALMGSSNLFSVLDAADEKQVLQCECKDKSALAMGYEEGRFAQPFPRCPWALDLSDKPFPGRAKFSPGGKDTLDQFARQWYWESGFDKDQVKDIELIRDHNFRAMYGAWDALKNVDGLYPNHRLGWAAFIAGKRESRRLLGDVVLDAKDFSEQRKYPDAAFPCSWHVDLHFPKKAYQKGFEGNEFIPDFTRGHGYEYGGLYRAPYRCPYSRNSGNLFMAGRNISLTKQGLGGVWAMKTCGIMGGDRWQGGCRVCPAADLAARCLRNSSFPAAAAHAAKWFDQGLAASFPCRLNIPLSWDTAFCLRRHNGGTSPDYAK